MQRRKLVEARLLAGKSQEVIGQLVGVERATIGKWERGESTPQPRQRMPYAAALNVSLNELDALLSDLPLPEGKTPMWLSQYLGMEQSAVAIRSHVTTVVFGLFQTADYAAAIARSVGVGETPETYIQRNIEQRAWRQARVESGDLNVSVVHSEMVLRLRMGDDATMAGQMQRLLDLGQQDNVTIQIVPFSKGQYEAMRMGTFYVMSHPWVQGDSVYLVRHEGAALVDNIDEAANFVAAYEQASELALSPDKSLASIDQALTIWKVSKS